MFPERLHLFHADLVCRSARVLRVNPTYRCLSFERVRLYIV